MIKTKKAGIGPFLKNNVVKAVGQRVGRVPGRGKVADPGQQSDENLRHSKSRNCKNVKHSKWPKLSLSYKMAILVFFKNWAITRPFLFIFVFTKPIQFLTPHFVFIKLDHLIFLFLSLQYRFNTVACK